MVPVLGLEVLDGVCEMPQTWVHWSRSAVAFAGTTVWSASPNQMPTRGHGPVYPGLALRTRSPHWAGVLLLPVNWQTEALDWSVAQR